MKLRLVVEINDKDARWISECAIERAINTSIDIAENSKHPDARINIEDWSSAKGIVTLLWIILQDAIFRHTHGLEEQK